MLPQNRNMQVYILIEHYHQEDIMGESLGCSLKVKVKQESDGEV